jgi:molecular chaperone GrpE
VSKRKTSATIQGKDAPTPEQAAETTPGPETESDEHQPGAAEPHVEEGATEPRESDAATEGLEEESAAEPPEEEGTDEPPGEPEEEDTAVKIADLEGRLLRALAEIENVRRRGAKERDDVSKYAITAFARDLLPVIDNLRRAIESVPEELRADEGLAGLVAGIEMTERELLSVFDRHGIRRVEPLGEKFDHNLHQAIFEVEDSDEPAGTVVQVVQVGYVLADRLLRAAMVGVAKAPKPPAPIDTEA